MLRRTRELVEEVREAAERLHGQVNEARRLAGDAKSRIEKSAALARPGGPRVEPRKGSAGRARVPAGRAKPSR